ncbi:hypothetical protein WKI13_13170 [Teredinibacter turnerae]|uniref:hypothetical protein n=1 Tax=Teredinibacter turnerae TaxID=2426 RepID=UPI0003A759AE|nr:hypothetical protein [Teredinibacter turnerae]
MAKRYAATKNKLLHCGRCCTALSYQAGVVMKGICKLCKNESNLRESHILPKFIGKWIKKTSITGYLREHNELEKRAQDTAKEYLLCAECENLFSAWERNFANRIFYPFVDRDEDSANYEDWLAKFCASLSWRTLVFIMSKNKSEERSEDYNFQIESARIHLEKFLLGQVDNLNKYEQHLYPLDRIEYTTSPGMPPNINRYFLRTTALDIVGNNVGTFIYTKFPKFILLGVVKSNELGRMRSSRAALKQGKIFPKKYRWPDGFADYIVEKANYISGVTSVSTFNQTKSIG